MRTSRYSTTRKKACQQCSGAKAKCDRRPGNERCSRCTRRGLLCAYANTGTSEGPLSPFSELASSFTGPESGMGVMDANNSPQRADPLSTPSTIISGNIPLSDEGVTASPCVSDTLHIIDFSDLHLICPINADDIQNRWIQAYIPIPGQTIKEYPTGVSSFIFSILKSYAAVAVSGRRMLPFIHSKQMTAQPTGSPLTTCLSLVRICSNPLPGSNDASAGILQREMHSLYEARDKYNAEALFAAFQAHLIYTMILFFLLNQSCTDPFRAVMTNLQELACATARQGLVCAADEQRVRPRWEEWIVAEGKRRTLYVMYLFDSILSTQEGLPTFLGTELRGLPAPANKLLWQAETQYEWEREYNIHMAEWMEGSLTIDELWPPPADLGETGVARRRARIDRWMENLDEYGTMLFAVMRCTHGG